VDHHSRKPRQDVFHLWRRLERHSAVPTSELLRFSTPDRRPPTDAVRLADDLATATKLYRSRGYMTLRSSPTLNSTTIKVRALYSKRRRSDLTEWESWSHRLDTKATARMVKRGPCTPANLTMPATSRSIWTIPQLLPRAFLGHDHPRNAGRERQDGRRGDPLQAAMTLTY